MPEVKLVDLDGPGGICTQYIPETKKIQARCYFGIQMRTHSVAVEGNTPEEHSRAAQVFMDKFEVAGKRTLHRIAPGMYVAVPAGGK